LYRKIPWRLSRHQKYRQRERLRHVDSVVATLDNALARTGLSMKKVDRWKMEMPTEQEMLPKDKYTVFDRKVKRYRKGIHSEWLLSSRRVKVTLIGCWGRYKCLRVDEQLLITCRGTKMDKSQPETQPPRFLNGRRWFCVYYLFFYRLYGLWRISGIDDISNSIPALKATKYLCPMLWRGCANTIGSCGDGR
jgi:hypothetical protein